MLKKINFIKNIYLALLGVLFLLIISTPRFVMADNVAQSYGNWIQIIVLVILAVINLVVYGLYRWELNKNQNNFNELINYTGSINVLIDQIKAVFCDIKNYPESKSDFRHILKLLAERVLSFVNVDWVMFRIVGSDNSKTLADHIKVRGAKFSPGKKISNEELLEGAIPSGLMIIKSDQDKFNLKIFCVLPISSINKEQEIMISKIVSDLGMLYLISSSTCYVNSRETHYKNLRKKVLTRNLLTG
jgi:hypothetical protein